MAKSRYIGTATAAEGIAAHPPYNPSQAANLTAASERKLWFTSIRDSSSGEGVELDFTQEALEPVADLAMKRGAGARALRAVVEEAMLDILYELPSLQGVRRCVIVPDTILGRSGPIFLGATGKRAKSCQPSLASQRGSTAENGNK